MDNLLCLFYIRLLICRFDIEANNRTLWYGDTVLINRPHGIDIQYDVGVNVLGPNVRKFNDAFCYLALVMEPPAGIHIPFLEVLVLTVSRSPQYAHPVPGSLDIQQYEPMC